MSAKILITGLTPKTAKFFYIPISRIIGKDQDRLFVIARQFMASVMASEITELRTNVSKTYEGIGMAIHRDRTTVIHLLDSHIKDLHDKRYNELYKSYLSFVGVQECEKEAISIDTIIMNQNLKWVQAIEKNYGKNLNETLLKNHIMTEL